MLIYSAGLRVGEVVRLKIGDVDGERRMIHLRGAKGKSRRDAFGKRPLHTFGRFCTERTARLL
jgi:site-specific recombinase XerD